MVELRPEPTIAAGEAGHGLGELLGAETIRLHEGDRLPPRDAGGRSCSSYATPTGIRGSASSSSRTRSWSRPACPSGGPTAARAFVATNGPGRANLAAAAEVLRS